MTTTKKYQFAHPALSPFLLTRTNQNQCGYGLQSYRVPQGDNVYFLTIIVYCCKTSLQYPPYNQIH